MFADFIDERPSISLNETHSIGTLCQLALKIYRRIIHPIVFTAHPSQVTRSLLGSQEVTMKSKVVRTRSDKVS